MQGVLWYCSSNVLRFYVESILVLNQCCYDHHTDDDKEMLIYYENPLQDRVIAIYCILSFYLEFIL